MVAMLPLSLSLSFVVTLPLVSAQYTLVKDYSGPSFFDDWEFYGACDYKANMPQRSITNDGFQLTILLSVQPSTLCP